MTKMLLKITLFLTIVGLIHCQEDRDSDRRPNILNCGRGWTEFDGSCYVFIRDLKNWYSARRFCRGYGADLVSISSVDENDFVADLAEGNEAWIGMHDEFPPAGMLLLGPLGGPNEPLKLEAKWLWTYSTPTRKNNRVPRQPSRFQDCVNIKYKCKGLWDDNDFFVKQYFVCERQTRRREREFRRGGNRS